MNVGGSIYILSAFEVLDSQGLPQTLLIHNLVMSTLFGLELFVSVECTKCQSLENRQ